ncbi:MAG TPA: FtsX-like permease family protein, partial [Geminicoccaceae bacterium]
MTTVSPTAGIGPALRFALRDLRGSLGGFAVFLACIALGVAAIAAVGNLNAGVAAAFARDASALLGGDVQLEQAGVPVQEDELAPLLPPGSRVSRVVRTSSLLEGPDGRHVPVTLKAVDDAYPLLGEVRLTPATPLADTLRDGGIAAEAAVLSRLGVRVGDRLRLGDSTVRLAAVLEREPDRIGGLFAVGPRVLVSDELLAASGLVQPGALVRYEHRIDLPAGVDADRFARDLKAARPDAGWRVQTSAEVQPQVARLTDRLATFLSLAGLTALVIGGLGVAMAVQTHLARRTASIATLKCLGATGRQIVAAYLAQIMAVAALGTLLGLVLGGALLLALAGLADRYLPVRLDIVLDPAATLVAAGAGLLTALTFGLLPLVRARDGPPAAVFRSPVAATPRLPRRADIALGAGCALALAGLAVLGVPRP